MILFVMLLQVADIVDDEGSYVCKIIAIEVEFQLFRCFPLKSRSQEYKVFARGWQTGVVGVASIDVEKEAGRHKAHCETSALRKIAYGRIIVIRSGAAQLPSGRVVETIARNNVEGPCAAERIALPIVSHQLRLAQYLAPVSSG